MADNSVETMDSNENATGEPSTRNRHIPNLVGLLERLRALKEASALLQEERDAVSAELDDLLLTSRLSSKEYRQARNQFIDVFKRDKLGASDGPDSETTWKGYISERPGDAIVDAALYTSKERFDMDTFERLYGLDPLRVSDLKYEPAIIAINAHAGTVSSQCKVGNEKFYESFAAFIKLLKATGYGEGCLDDGESDRLMSACQFFLECNEMEVRDV